MKAICAIAIITAGMLPAQNGQSGAQWPMAGQSLSDNRNQPNETLIGPSNVASLGVKWTFTTGGDVSATPAVAGSVFVPDWAGNLYGINSDTGAQIWSRTIASYDGFPGAISRVTPAVHKGDIIIGDRQASSAHDGANVMAVNRGNGALHWITKVDSHPAAIITGSPVVFNDVVFVGVASSEEGIATDPNYVCCTFRGSIVALNAETGAILWKTFTVPEGYSGGAVWQPVAIDPSRGSLFAGTGNNYSVPPSVLACQQQTPNSVCTSPDDHFDSALALDLNTGRIKWATGVQQFDTWTVACLSNPPGANCFLPASPDFDFSGSGPNLVGNIVGMGQKSGIYWAFNPDTGKIIWSTAVGPGGTLGGIEWGTASDGQRIYVAITNNSHIQYTLVNGQTIDWGSWAALDVATGKILWQTADPTPGALDMGAVSVANGVVYAGTFTTGIMYGMDAKTGKILFSFSSGGSVIDSPSIANGVVYWGSGYKHIGGGTANNKVFAFTVK